MSRFSLDTNILVYAADQRDRRSAPARDILAAAETRDCVLTLQSLGEFFRAVTGKRIVPPAEAARLIEYWLVLFPRPAIHGEAALRIAITASAAGRFAFWDAMLLATAHAAGCAAVISEDMAPGATLEDVRIVAAFDKGAISAEARDLLGLA